ncbi:MAG: hypothetical protein IPM61_01075 [Chlorobi bacterium]|nr:MAG: hypothetical protein UZ07_CHB004003185 [Chlorobi bacterium OLB7]MBK8909900.1 hypothetical protein [Chlorobiota bacterium]MBX7215653.1 hypothetical protein [Candidatus Kapabacteria bacterium]
MTMIAIRVFSEEKKKIEIAIHNRSHPESEDFDDANWLNAIISVSVIGFTATVEINLRSEDIIDFYHQVIETIKGNSLDGLFSNLEENIYIKYSQKKSGSILWAGYVRDFEGNMLQFSFSSDYMVLIDIKGQLKAVMDKYPLIIKD